MMEVVKFDQERNAIRTFEELSPQEQQIVEAKKKGLDYKDTVQIIQFGAEDADELSRFSSDLFKGFRIQDFDEFDVTMRTLMENLKKVDPNSLMEVEASKWQSLPIIGTLMKSKLVTKVNDVIVKHATVEQVIEEVLTSLERTKYAILKDMTLSQEMRKKSYDYADKQELNFITITQLLQEARAEREAFVATYNPNNVRDTNVLSDMGNSIVELERKQVAIATYRLMSLQNLPKLNFIHNATEAMASKIDDIKINVIPQWKQQFGLAIFAFHMRNSAYVLQSVRLATEEIYRRSGLMLNDALKATAGEIEALPVSLEALNDVNSQLMTLCQELIDIESESKKVRQKAIPEIQKLQQSILDSEAKLSQKRS